MLATKSKLILMALALIIGCLSGCSEGNNGGNTETHGTVELWYEQDEEIPETSIGEIAMQNSVYTDKNGDKAVIPNQFRVSDKEDEQTVSTGLVVIGPDGSEFVWIPTTKTELKTRDFGGYVSWGASFKDYYDETELQSYRAMITSVEKYGGFYMGRYEASFGGGDSTSSYTPASKRGAEPWVRFDPADTDAVCQNLYADNESVQGFFPWGDQL